MNFYAPPMAVLFFFYLKSGWICAIIKRKKKSQTEVFMNSRERVRAAILGGEIDRQPIYGWVYANLTNEINEKWGSVAAFEDKYEFDAAHIFGGPRPWDKKLIERLSAETTS